MNCLKIQENNREVIITIAAAVAATTAISKPHRVGIFHK